MPSATAQIDSDLVADLQRETAAVKVKTTKMGTRRSFRSDQIKKAAVIFGANEDYVNASKKLLDTANPAYLAVSGVFYRAGLYRKMSTVPYPEDGLRLIKKDKIDEFEAQMRLYRQELEEAVTELQAQYDALRDEAATRLGELFDAADYPTTLDESFSLDWEYPSISPPEYLKEINPELYERQCQRIKAKFEEAIQLTEQAFTEELSSLVGHLFDRLSPQEVQIWSYDGKETIAAVEVTQGFAASGIAKLEAITDRELTVDELADLDSLTKSLEAADDKMALVKADAIELRGGTVTAIDDQNKKTKFEFDTTEEAADWLVIYDCKFERTKVEKKTFRDTAVTGMNDFFERFRSLNIGSNAELDRLVEQASNLVNGVDPALVRKDDNVRNNLHTGLGALRDQIETMLVDRKSRGIVLED